MGYSDIELAQIYEQRPDLRKSVIPSLDSLIVLFLEKYEVYLKPPSTKDGKSLRESAIAGGFAGLSPIAGLGVAGIQGQRNNADKHEWIQWKQWALDHKDFPAFKEETLLRFEEERNQIAKDPLSNPVLREEIAELIRVKRRGARFVGWFIFGAFAIPLVGLLILLWWLLFLIIAPGLYQNNPID